MPPILYYHPLSSYSWKALIALYEAQIDFTPRIIDADQPDSIAEWLDLWPIAHFPVLRDGERTIAEASIIVEYAGQRSDGRFAPLPADVDAALDARMWDRVFDNEVMGSMQVFVLDRIRPADARDPHGVERAGQALARAYDMLETRMCGRDHPAGDAFGLADCAAMPSLFYADRIMPFRATHPALAAYLARLEARPSVMRVLAEKQPYWHMFPFAEG